MQIDSAFYKTFHDCSTSLMFDNEDGVVQKKKRCRIFLPYGY